MERKMNLDHVVNTADDHHAPVTSCDLRLNNALKTMLRSENWCTVPTR